MVIRVRTGSASDIGAAAGIWERAHQKHDGLNSESASKGRAHAFLSSRTMIPDAEFLVAEFNAEIVGMLFAQQARERDGAGAPIPRLMHVSYVAVDPEHWSHGVATRLLDQIVCHAQKKGYERLQLWVEAENERARNLYERDGFVYSGREKFDDHGLSIMHYEMELGSSAAA